MKKIVVALILALALILPALSAPKAKGCCADKAKVSQMAKKDCCADKAQAKAKNCTDCKGKKQAKDCCADKAQAKKGCCEKMASDKGCGSTACGWFAPSVNADCKACNKTAMH